MYKGKPEGKTKKRNMVKSGERPNCGGIEGANIMGDGVMSRRLKRKNETQQQKFRFWTSVVQTSEKKKLTLWGCSP